MVTLSLDFLRRLFGAAGPRASSASSFASGDFAPGSDLIYRLKAWPRLPEAGRTAEIYRMLSIMSSRPVNRQWILTRVRMERRQLEAMLRQWVSDGAIEVIDPDRFAH